MRFLGALDAEKGSLSCECGRVRAPGCSLSYSVRLEETCFSHLLKGLHLSWSVQGPQICSLASES